MSLRAIALHASIWRERFEELSGPPLHRIFAGGGVVTCTVCNAPFVILLCSYLDTRNAEYRAALEKIIAGECTAAGHVRTEIELEFDA